MKSTLTKNFCFMKNTQLLKSVSMKKIYLILVLSCLSILANAQTAVTLYSTGTAGSFKTGSCTSTTRTDGSLVVINTSRGYAVFDLSSIPANSIITNVTLGTAATAYTAATAGAQATYGWPGDLSLVSTPATLFANCVGGTLLSSTAYTTGAAAFTNLATAVQPSAMTTANVSSVISFIQNNIGSKVSICYTTNNTRTWTFAGETGNTTSLATAGHAPAITITYYTGTTTASLPFFESFENTWTNFFNTRDKAGSPWTVAPYTGNNSVRKSADGGAAAWSSSNGPLVSNGSVGTGAAQFHSYDASLGYFGYLDLYVDMSLPGNKTINFDYTNASGTDVVVCKVSADNGLTFATTGPSLGVQAAWTAAGTLTTSVVSPRALVRWQFTSDYGISDIGIDNIKICPTAGALTVTAAPNPVCVSQTLTLTPNITTGTAYAWSGPAGFSSTSTIATRTAAATSAGVYTLSATLGACGVYTAVTSAVTVNTSPSVTVSPATSCSPPVTFVTTPSGSASYTYAWSPNTSISSTAAQNPTVSPASIINYSLTVTAANGCTVQGFSSIGPAPTVSTVPSGTFCGQSVTASGAGVGGTYTWSPSAGLSATTGATVIASPTVTTTYTITGTTTALCSGTTTIVVTATPSFSVTPVLFCSAPATLAATATVGSGATITGYTWSPSVGLTTTVGSTTSATLSGTYVESVTASNGCSSTRTYTVSTLPTITASAGSALLCSGGTTSLTGSGGATYVWSPASSLSASSGTTVTATPPTGSTTYTVTGTTAAGCANTGTVSVGSGAQVATMPFTESFESPWMSCTNTNELPNTYWVATPVTGNNSWRQDNTTAAAGGWSSTGGAYSPVFAPSAGARSARFHSYDASGTTGTLDLYITFPVGSKKIQYSYINPSSTSDQLRLKISLDNGSSFTDIDVPPAVATTWTTRSVTVSSVPVSGSTAILRWSALGDFGADDIGLDAISVTQLPSATASVNPAAFGGVITGTTATLMTTLTASGLTPASGSLTVTAPANFSFISPGTSTTTSSYTINYSSSGTSLVNPVITVNFTPATTLTYSGTITITGGGLASPLLIPVSGNGATACGGTPTTGTVSSTVSTGCTAYSSTLSLTAAPSAAGISYRWMSSTDNVTFTNASGTYTSPTYNASVSSNIYYLCSVTCSYSGSSASSASALLTAGTQVASLPFTESFETTWLSCTNTNELPNNYWVSTPVTGNNSWRQDNTTAAAGGWSSVIGAYSPTFSTGARSARFHSYDASSISGTLDLYVNFPAGSKQIQYSYINPSGSDQLRLQISLDNGATYSNIDVPPTIATTWTQRTVYNSSVPSSGTTARLRWMATGDFGADDIGLDGISVGIFATPPTLTAAPSATVDAPFNVTFTDDPAWRAAITSIVINGTTTLTSGSSVTLSNIIFTPASSSPASLLQTSGTLSIVINATGYIPATVSQPLGVGAPNKLVMVTQPAAPTINGNGLNTQPVVKVGDQYGNTITGSTATITAAASTGTGSWTLGGTVSQAATSGSLTYTDLSATSAGLVPGASITFSSSGIASVVSGTFNIPAPPLSYYNIANTDLSDPNNWGLNTDGSGAHPSFATVGNNYKIINGSGTDQTIASNWTVVAGSYITLGDGVNPINFVIPSGAAVSAASATVYANSLATLTIRNSTVPTLGTLAASSTIDYSGTNAYTITSATTYGNLTFSSSGTSTIASGTYSVLGNFTQSAGTLYCGNAYIPTVINVNGNFNLNGNALFTQSVGSSDTIRLKGNFIQGGTAYMDNPPAWNVVRMCNTSSSASNPQTIINTSLNGSVARYSYIYVDPGCYVKLAGQFNWTGSVYIGMFVDGTLDLSDQQITGNGFINFGSTSPSTTNVICARANGLTGALINTPASATNPYTTNVYNAGVSYTFNGLSNQTTPFPVAPNAPYNLTVNTTGTLTANGALSNTTGTLTVASGATLDMGTNLINTTGTITNNGTIKTSVPTSTSATPIPAGITYGGTVEYAAATGAQTIVNATYNNLTLSNASGTQVPVANMTVNGALSITATGGTLSLSTFTLGGSLTAITNNGTIQTTNTSATPIPTARNWAGTGTVQYAATGGGQTIVAGTYNNLTASNNGGSTDAAGGNLTVNGNLTTTAGGTVSLSTFAMNGTLATVTNGGTIVTNNTSAAPLPSGNNWGAAGTVQFAVTGGGQTIPSGTYNNLTASNSSANTAAGGNLTVNGTLTTTSGGTLSLSTFAMNGTLSTITNNGTIATANTSAAPLTTGKNWGAAGTVSYIAGSGSQTVMQGTYNNLTLANTSGTNTASGSINVGNTLTTSSGGTLDMATFALGGALTTVSHSGTLITNSTVNPPIPNGKTWGGLVNYTTAGGSQTVASGNYNNLTLSNTSGANTAAGNLVVGGAFTNTAGGTLNMGANTLTGSLTSISGTGIIKTQNTGGTPIASGKSWTQEVQYNASSGSQTVVVGTYATLTNANSTGTNTMAGAVSVTNGLSLSLNSTMNNGGFDITNAGSVTGAGTVTGAGNVIMTGTGTTISNATLSNLNVNAASGVTLGGNPTVTSGLTFSNGLLTTGTSNYITVNGSVTGAGSSKYVNGILVLPVTGANTRYDVGDVSYAPVDVAFNGVTTPTGNLGVGSFAGPHPDLNNSSIDNSINLNHYYKFPNLAASGFTSITPTFNYNSGDVAGGDNSAFKIQMYDVSGNTWSPIVTVTTSNPTTLTTSGTITAYAGKDVAIGIAPNGVGPALVPFGSSFATYPTTGGTGNISDGSHSITFTGDGTWEYSNPVVTAQHNGAGTIITLVSGVDYILDPGATTLTPGSIKLIPTGSNAISDTGYYTIVASVPGVYTASSCDQYIMPGAAAGLAIRTQPSNTSANPGAPGAPVVIEQDSYGNPTSGSDLITANVGTGGWTIGGSTAVNASAGVATFSSITAGYSSGPLSGATISFTSPVGSVVSGTFNIAAPAPPTLTAAPSASVDAPFAITFTSTPAWSGAVSAVSVNGTPVTYVVGGTAITLNPSPNAALHTSGTKNIVVAATGYVINSIAQTLTAGVATTLTISAQPTGSPYANGGTIAGSPAVQLFDQYGNLCANGVSASAVVSVTATGTTWVAGGTTSLSASSGTATFSGITASTATGLTSSAASVTFSTTTPALTSAASSTFVISAGAHTWYAKSGTSLNLNFTSNWAANSDGTGVSPSNFTTANQIYQIGAVGAGYTPVTPTLSASWPVSGTGSKVVVGDGTNAVTFTIPSGMLVGNTIDVANNARVNLATASTITFGTLHANSTIEYSNAATPTFANISAPGYGNVVYSGASGNLALAAGTYTIRGNFTHSGGGQVVCTGSPTINVGGSVTIASSANYTTASGSAFNMTIGGNFTQAGTSNLSVAGGTNITFNGASSFASPQIWKNTSTGANTLNTYTISAGSTVQLGSTVTISSAGYALNINGGLDMQAFSVGGPGNFILNGANTTLYNSSTTGLTGGILVSGTKTLTAGADYVFYAGTNTTNPWNTAATNGAPRSVTINTSGTWTSNIAFAPSTTLTVSSASVMNMGTNQLTGAFVPANSGIIKTSNTAVPPIPAGKVWGGEVQYATTGLTIAQGTYNNLTLQNGAGAANIAGGALTVNGALTTTAGGTMSLSTFAMNGTLTSVTNNGTIATANTSAAPLPSGINWAASGAGTVQYALATGTQTIVGGTYNHLTASNTSNAQMTSGNLTVNGAFTTSSGGTVSLSTFTLGGTLATIANAGTISTASTSSAAIPSGKTWNGTVVFAIAAGGQTIASGTYSNLTASNTGSSSAAGGNLTVNGTLTTTAGGTVDLGTFALNGTLTTITNNGTIATQNTSATPIITGRTWSGTVNYNSASGTQTIVLGTYTNLTSGNTGGTNTAGGNLNVNSTLSVASGGTLDLSTFVLGGTLSTISNSGAVILAQNTSGTPVPTGKVWGGLVSYNNGVGGQTVMAGTYNDLTMGNALNTNTASGALTVNGTLTNTAGGTLNMGTNVLNGTLAGLSGSGIIKTQNTSALPVPTGMTWPQSIWYNAAGGGQTVVVGTYANIVNAGATNTLAGDIQVTGSATLTLGSVLADASHIITNSGSILGTGTLSGTGGVVMTGASTTISGVTLDNLTLNNAAGFGMSGSATVNGNLTFTNGILSTGSNGITVNGSVIGAGALAYVSGKLAKPVNTGTFTFYEVGDADYAPVNLDFLTSGTPSTPSGVLAVGSYMGPHPHLNTSLLSGTDNVAHYYSITDQGGSASGFTDINATFTYNTGDINNGTNDNTGYAAQVYSGSTWGAIIYGTTNSLTPTVNSVVPLTSAAFTGDIAIGKVPPLAPVLTPYTTTTPTMDNVNDGNHSISFPAGSTLWENAVTGGGYITAQHDGGTVNTLVSGTDYVIVPSSSTLSGQITLIPNNTLPHYIKDSGDYTISVYASGYTTASCIQTIYAGAPQKLIMHTQPSNVASNGGHPGTPVVYVADNFDNLSSSSAIISAGVGAGAWTISGTTTATAVNGVATFPNINASSLGPVTGATITFSEGTLGTVTSGSFTIVAPAPPVVSVATGNTSVDGPIVMTYAPLNSVWDAAVTGITVNGTSLSLSAYAVSGGSITLTPSASTLLQSTGSKTIVISATGFSSTTPVAQTIIAGTVTTISITQQPTAPPTNGGLVGNTPTVILKDQYNNQCTNGVSASAGISATASGGLWTPSGTTVVTASAGTAVFTALNAGTSSGLALTGATITFINGSVSSVASNPFNIPYGPHTWYSKSGTNLNLNFTSNWAANSDGTGGAPANFTNDNQIYQINALSGTVTPSLSANWTVSGTSSKVVVGDGINAVNFTLPTSYTLNGTIDVANTGVLTLNNSNYPTWGTLATNSTVDFSSTIAYTLPAVNWGNLTISTSGAVAASGTNTVLGTFSQTGGTVNNSSATWNVTGGFSMSNAAVFAASSATAINVGGSVTLTGTSKLTNTGFTTTFTFNGASSFATPKYWTSTTSGTHTGLAYTVGSSTVVSLASNCAVPTGCTFTTGTGAVDLNTNKISGSGSFTAASGGTVYCANAGGLTTGLTIIGKTFTAGANYNFYIAGTSTTLNTVTPWVGTLGNPGLVTINTPGGTWTANQAFSPSTTLTVTANTTVDMTNLTLGGAFVPANSGTIMTSNTANPPIPNTKNWGGTIQYTATAGTQTIAGGTYNNLTLLNTSANNTANGNVTVNGALTTTAGGTMSLSTFTMNGTLSTVSNGGSIVTSNTSATPFTSGVSWGVTGLVQYAVTNGGQTIMAGTYNNLTISNSALTNTASGPLAVNGTLVTTSGGTLDLGTTGVLSGTLATITNPATIKTSVPTTTSATPLPSGKNWGTGTIQYAASGGGQTVVAGSYASLTMLNSGGTNTASGQLNVSGTLTTTASGTLDLSTYDLAGTLTTITNNGTLITQSTSATPIPSGRVYAGTIQYVSAIGGQTIVGGTYTNLALNNTAANSSLGADVTVGTTLTLTSGKLDIGASNLIMGATANAIAGTPSPSNMIITSNTGQVRKLATTTATASYTFPIGSGSSYSPVITSYTGGTFGAGAYVAMNVKGVVHPNNANTTDYLKRYWTLATSGITGGISCSLTATYDPADVTGTEANISGAKYPSATPWVKYGSVNTGTHSFTTTAVTNTTADFSGIKTAPPTVSITPASIVICNGSSTTLTAVPVGDPNFTYSWSGPRLSATTGVSVLASPTTTATSTVTAVYTVTATDGNGFTSAIGTATVTAYPPVNPGTISGSTTLIVGGNITLTDAGATGGPTGVWATSDPTVASVLPAGAVTGVHGIADGTAVISYTVTSPCGSFASATFTVSAQSPPTITSVSSNSAIPGSTITITGTNFSGTPSSNIVKFGAVSATIDPASTGTSLIVTVPVGATNDPLFVTNQVGLSAFSQYPFLPKFDTTLFINPTCPDAPQINFLTKVDFTAGTAPYNTAIGDLDGDGKPDMVAVNNTSNNISVFKNISTTGVISGSSFTLTGTYAGGGALQNVKIADLDGDGKPEILVTSKTSSQIDVFHNTNTVAGTMSINSSYISIATSNATTHTGGPIVVTVADIDGDGKPDMVTNSYDGNGSGIASVSVMRNVYTTIGSLSSASFASPVVYSLGALSTFLSGSITTADLDGDKKPEVIVTNSYAGTITILPNNSYSGNISLGTGVNLTVGAGANASLPSEVQVGDLNGDGYPDIVVSAAVTDNIAIFPNTNTTPTAGSFTFGTRLDVSTGTGSQPVGIAIADVNGDGMADVIVGKHNTGVNKVSVFRNISSGGSITLATAVDYTTGTTTTGVVAGDLDGDTYPDIVTANSGTNTISVIKDYPLPVVKSITGTFNICSDGSAATTLSNATPTGTWTLSNYTNATIGSTSGYLVGLARGTDVVTYSKNVRGQINYATANISIKQGVIGTVNATPASICSGGVVTLTTATPPYLDPTAPTYTWSGPGISATTGLSINGSSTVAPVNLTSSAVNGSFSVTIHPNDAVCADYTATTSSIAVNPQPSVTVTAAVNGLICVGLTETLSAITVGGSGTPNYSWSGPGLATATSSSSIYSFGVIYAPANPYSVTVTYTDATCIPASNITATVTPTKEAWVGGYTGHETEWAEDHNWTCGTKPLATDDITIGVATNIPEVSSPANGVARDIVVLPGASVVLNPSAALSIKGNVTNQGALTGTGKMVLNGLIPQTIDSIGSVSNLELDNTNGATMHTGSMVTIGQSLILTNGTFATNDSLLLESSDTASTARIAPITSGASITNKVIVHQYIQGGYRRYRFWSHPFSTDISLGQLQSSIDITGTGGSANGFTTTGSNAPSAFRYDPYNANSTLSYDTGWRAFTNIGPSATGANLFHPYQGLRIFMRGAKGEGLGYWFGYTPSDTVIGMTGPVNQGNQTITLLKGGFTTTLGVQAQEYNMVGNPYPSPVDLGAVVYNASVGGQVVGSAFYVWNPSLGASGQFQAIPISSVTPYYLPAYAAYQVRAHHDGATLNFTESHKSANATNYLFKSQPDAISLYVYDVNYHPYDMLYVKFNDQASEAEDKYLDATKPSGADFNFYSMSSDNKKMVIDSRPYNADKVVPLGISSAYQQDFIIKAEGVVTPGGAKVYLHDKLLQKYVAMDQGAEYRFTIGKDKATQGDNRFELTMKPAVTVDPKGLQVTMTPNPATDEVKVKFTTGQPESVTLRVLDMSGVSVYSEDLGVQQKGIVSVPLSKLASGIYMVEISCGGQKITQRLVKE